MLLIFVGGVVASLLKLADFVAQAVALGGRRRELHVRVGECALGGVREAQLSYARYRAESDPARPMLTRLFGGEFAERLIREVLFDLPLRLDEEHSSSAAHGAADTRWRRSYDGRAA